MCSEQSAAVVVVVTVEPSITALQCSTVRSRDTEIVKQNLFYSCAHVKACHANGCDKSLRAMTTTSDRFYFGIDAHVCIRRSSNRLSFLAQQEPLGFVLPANVCILHAVISFTQHRKINPKM